MYEELHPARGAGVAEVVAPLARAAQDVVCLGDQSRLQDVRQQQDGVDGGEDAELACVDCDITEFVPSVHAAEASSAIISSAANSRESR